MSGKGKTKIIYARVDAQLARDFRVEVARHYGGERGAISRAIEEAILLWLSHKRTSGSD